MKLTEKQDRERISIVAPYVNKDAFRQGRQHKDIKHPEKWQGGLVSFAGMPHGVLKQLVDKGYAALNDRQNAAPSLGEFLTFMRSHPECTCSGYIVSRFRDDCRISIDSLHCHLMTSRRDIEQHLDLGSADDISTHNGSTDIWWD